MVLFPDNRSKPPPIDHPASRQEIHAPGRFLLRYTATSLASGSDRTEFLRNRSLN